MADPLYNVKVYIKQGGDQMVIASGGSIKIETGGSILPNSGTQAAHIAHVTATGTTFVSGDKAKLNALIDAVQALGVLATS